MSEPLRLAFAGTPEFAVPALEALARSRHSVVLVLTQPDRPAGRGRQLAASPVKVAARGLGIDVRQPAELKSPESAELLRAYDLDALIVVAYGLLLPQHVLEIPRLGCINVHASLLPRWRGAAPVQRAILAGDSHTGISIMKMEAGLDTGPVYLRRPIAITPEDTAGTLERRLAQLGAECIVEALDAIASGAQPEPQQGEATYAHKIDKKEAVLDWTRPAAGLERAVRAFNPRPVAETRWRGEQLRIWSAKLAQRDRVAPPGTIIRADAGGLVIACGEGALALEVVQLPGRRPASYKEFLNAHAPLAGVLGEG